MDDDESELAMIRRKKMTELVEREKKQKAEKEQRVKVDAERKKLLKRFLDQQAQAYLERLKTTEPAVGAKVEEVLLYLIVYRGVRQTIEQLDVMYVERQVKGEEPKIRVQRDGETSEFGKYVRDAMHKAGGSSDSD